MNDSEESYFRVGRLALKVCLDFVDADLVRHGNILDFPSGYGRVLRHFAHKFPKAKIFTCELDSRMLEFTENEFGAIPVQANEECLINFETKMDLIFTGSLLTHFDEYQWDNYFVTIENALSNKGVCVFTTHGRRHAMRAKNNDSLFGDIIDPTHLYRKYRECGFAFLPYSADYPSFGLSLASPSWISSKLEKIPGLEICGFSEGLWGQDVWAVRKSPWQLAEI